MTDETSSVQPSGEGTVWLYRQHGLLLGPITYEAIVAEIENGNIAGDAEACQQGQTNAFRPVSEEPLFMVALAKAEAKNKVEAQHRDAVNTRRKAAGIKGGIIIVFTIFGFIIIAALTRYLAVNRPWERKVTLPDPIITDELPVISLSSRRASSEEEGLAYPIGNQKPAQSQEASASAPVAVAQNTAKGDGRQSGQPSASKKHASAAKTSSKASRTQQDSSGLTSQQEWDEDAIQQVLAAKKKTIHPCLTEEVHRQSASNPTWSARIPLEFTVSNSGKVVKLWIDHYEFKSPDSALYKCIFKALSTWKFPAYAGEQANVSLAFNVQARP